ncbi:unnamed protein product [Trichogramma brassicae]|uniref:Uncharacterized protein n=1 Tax=Trichogramma brassicae TaxID=86971 RepID=A0A6H5IL20_9HYME|nr:unnamed protein product [Trichogramma brassicae]
MKILDHRFISDSDSDDERYLRFRAERPDTERLPSERLRSIVVVPPSSGLIRHEELTCQRHPTRPELCVPPVRAPRAESPGLRQPIPRKPRGRSLLPYLRENPPVPPHLYRSIKIQLNAPVTARIRPRVRTPPRSPILPCLLVKRPADSRSRRGYPLAHPCATRTHTYHTARSTHTRSHTPQVQLLTETRVISRTQYASDCSRYSKLTLGFWAAVRSIAQSVRARPLALPPLCGPRASRPFSPQTAGIKREPRSDCELGSALTRRVTAGRYTTTTSHFIQLLVRSHCSQLCRNRKLRMKIGSSSRASSMANCTLLKIHATFFNEKSILSFFTRCFGDTIFLKRIENTRFFLESNRKTDRRIIKLI